MVTDAVPEAKLTIHPTSLVCVSCLIEGNVTIGPNTVVHPFSVIRAISGPIVIGEHNIVEEFAVIENVDPTEGHVMTIGNDNVFEIRSEVRAHKIGNNNVFSVSSIVAEGVVVETGCSVGIKCSVSKGDILADRTVIWGEHNHRRTSNDNPPMSREILEIYKKIRAFLRTVKSTS